MWAVFGVSDARFEADVVSVMVNVQPRLLRWARERAALGRDELAQKLNLNPSWIEKWEETGELSLSHLERVAEKTHTPIGYLFLDEPPEQPLPVADFRTHSDARPANPSPDLLDTIYQCEERQGWYRELVVEDNAQPLPFVGSATSALPIPELAKRIREAIGLSTAKRAAFSTWADALRDMFELIEAAGVLVMRNGVVGTNTHRRLSVKEFRGFALSDAFAPLVFVNAADSKSAQMFTLAHELVHLWRGESGVSDADPHSRVPSERYCNAAAAEILVPMDEFTKNWNPKADTPQEVQRLARVFKVSSFVVLIRAREADAISEESFGQLYEHERREAQDAKSGTSGGDFYRTQSARLGRRFATAVIASAIEGRTPYTEAFHLLGVRKPSTFDELARKLGVMP